MSRQPPLPRKPSLLPDPGSGRSPPGAPRFGRASGVPQRPPWLVDGERLFDDGVRCAREGRLEQAVALFDELLRLKPDHADALNDRGNALDLLRRRREALESYERALRVRPDHEHAMNGRANMLQAFGRLDEALAAYDAVLAIDPRYVHAWNGRGNTLMALNRHREAIDAYLAAQAIRPDHPDANFNEGLARLSLGDYGIGWRKHERRWQLPYWRPRLRGFARPAWLGDTDPRGRTLLLHAEQGFGDTLQFCRYVPLVAALGARVILEVQPALRGLLAQLPGVDRLLARGDPLPAFDAHCPLLSLPLALGTTLETIPAPSPVLRPAPAAAAQWAQRLGPRTRLRVGVAWQGNTGHDNDRNRSIPFERFAALCDPAIEVVSLQQQVLERDRDALARSGVPHFGDALRDFSDTAALVSQTDLVVAVDTSVAHLAAAMGRPTWVLLPWVADWRWLVDRTDSPWYPTVRLFRQSRPDDWASVLDEVRAALAALAAGAA